MTRAELVEHVRRMGAFESVQAAEAALAATLSALGVALVPSERRAVADALPPSLRPALYPEEHAPGLDLEGFYELVRGRTEVLPSQAREYAQVVCEGLSEALPWEVVAMLRRHLPWLAGLLEVRTIEPVPVAPQALRRPDAAVAPAQAYQNTLALGRPGSRHPLSEARPEPAHTHSIARSDDPHGATRLSSSHGLTQEREHETLADGRPGPDRSLGGS